MTPLVVAERLVKEFPGRRKGLSLFSPARPVRAVDSVSLTVGRGEAVGLVGESGSGKSTIGRLVMGLVEQTSGQVLFDGIDVAAPGPGQLQDLRRRMQLIFQDPYSSLDPRRTVGDQIAEGLRQHRLVPPGDRARRVAELLDQVGLGADVAARHPHAFSGGQRQRVGIARAMATSPDFIVADEPVSALDVSVQAQVIALLADLRTRLGLSMLFISHDLPVVRHLCDRVIVLYLGRVMEEGPTGQVFSSPRHPYTQALLSATPSLDPTRRRRRILLAGEPPSPANPPSGCVFRTRCPIAQPACAQVVPGLEDLGAGHHVACIRANEGPAAVPTAPQGDIA